MKKLIFWTFTFLFLVMNLTSGIQPLTAAAQDTAPSGYACVLSDYAYLYASPDNGQGLFLLPKTYYVKLLSYDEDYCKAEYLFDDNRVKRVVGYVKTDYLAPVDYIPRRPYLYYTFELCYRIENTENALADSFTQITFTCAYYGDFPKGKETWCYVLRDGEFGYVPKPADLAYEENTEYADYLASRTESPTPVPNENSSSTPAQIAILVALCLLVPLLAALILKPSRRTVYPEE